MSYWYTWTDNYAGCLWGWITVPETGTYTWHFISDDQGALYVSSDGTMANLEEVAYVATWARTGEWNKEATQTSAPVAYERGQVLAVFGCMTERYGYDLIGVAWTMPGANGITYISDYVTSRRPLEPLTAYDPLPPNGAKAAIPTVLRWKSDPLAVYHDVYFSRNATFFSRGGTFTSRQSTTEYVIPYALVPGTTYYWRVDEVEADGKAIHQGEVWSFTVADVKTLVVSVSPNGSVLTPGEGKFEIDAGTILPLEALVADPNHAFAGWSGTAVDADRVQDPEAAQTTILIDANYTLEAVFVKRAEGPVLGFSLGELKADEPNEFNYRVTTNNTEEAIFVERVTGLPPDPNGMVRMHVVDGEPARAKMRFGRCYAERVLVQFQYLFEDLETTEIVVYLSDVPQLLEHGDPLRLEHYIKIGRVAAPPPSRPGAFNSRRFGTFEEWAWGQGLDFSNGTWIELELVGEQGLTAMSARGGLHLASGGEGSALTDGASVQVQCSGYCMDVTSDKVVTSQDILLVLAACGSTASLDKGDADSRYCLDGLFSRDGYVDSLDAFSWDFVLEDISRSERGNLCEAPLSDISSLAMSGAGPFDASSTGGLHLAAGGWPAGLLVLGKPQWMTRLSNVVTYNFYLFDNNAAYTAPYITTGLPQSCNIRVVRGRDHQVYLVNSEQGVLRLSDGSPEQVIAAGQADYDHDPRYLQPARIFIGMQGAGASCFGRPLLDVAFDAQGYAYVTPVVVQPDGNEPYAVAAKLRLDSSAGPSAWQIVQLYDDPPAAGENRVWDYLREIEVDGAGHVYLLNVYRRNESDILWKYSNDGVPLRQWFLAIAGGATNVPDPLGLTVPIDGDTMYLASGQYNRQDPGSSVLYGLSAEAVDVFVTRSVTIRGMALVSSITQDPTTGNLWVLGFNTVRMPPRPGMKEYFDHVPCLARVPFGAKVVLATEITGCDLALPTSIICTTGAR